MIFMGNCDNYNVVTEGTSQTLGCVLWNCETAENAFRCAVLSEATRFSFLPIVRRIVMTFQDSAGETE
jgi:hypothetical protein